MSLERFVLDEAREARDREALSSLLVILWHGAGGDIDETSLAMTAGALAAEGATVARARFAYRREGKRRPDRAPALLADARETITLVRETVRRPRLLLGGRSMGGRMSSMLVADGAPADGLLLLSYPLHPPQRPSELRDAHLDAIPCPMLFMSGDRDPFAELDRLEPVIARLGARARLELFPGAAHSLRKKADLARAAALSVSFARSLVSPT